MLFFQFHQGCFQRKYHTDTNTHTFWGEFLRKQNKGKRILQIYKCTYRKYIILLQYYQFTQSSISISYFWFLFHFYLCAAQTITLSKISQTKINEQIFILLLSNFPFQWAMFRGEKTNNNNCAKRTLLENDGKFCALDSVFLLLFYFWALLLQSLLLLY